MSRESHARPELHRNPFRIFADFESEAFGINFNAGLVAASVGTDFEIRAQITAGSQRILGAWNVGMKRGAIPFDGNAHSALAKFVAAGACGAETERALTSLQIRNAHAREQHSGKFLRRKSRRNPDDRTEDPRLSQPMPERRSLPQALDFRFAERY